MAKHPYGHHGESSDDPSQQGSEPKNKGPVNEEDGDEAGDPYESVTSEGEGIPEEDELEFDLEAEDFEGEESEVELVEGVEAIEERAGCEGIEEGFVDEELEAIPGVGIGGVAPEEYGEQPETVCGNDDRVRIRRVTRAPWRWICQLIITKRGGGKSRCTGWFIGPRTVMTAGHCVHHGGGWARQIEVIPGMDSALRPFGSQVATSFRSVKGWTQSKKAEYDYGAIILPNDSLGKRVGWFGFCALSTRSLTRLLVNNSGYPGDKPFGTQWYNAGRITKVTSRRLYYMLDTYGGQSGSPTWRTRRGRRQAVGVHAYGGCPNKSTRITGAVFNNMMAWRRLGGT